MEITMKGISKAFGSNEVLKGVDLTLKSGEIHALMGENGAGKSTLMNILTGIHKADSGTICVDGREISFKNALEAEKCGIAFIHQELNIWPNLSILENLFLMQNVTNSFGMLDFKKMRRLAEEKCSQMGITLPFDAEAGECSVGQQQMTEIMRNLMLDAKVVIMDEPTAALTERETEKLFAVMHALKDKGVAIVYISHRMEEVFAHCDTITVMRDGYAISSKPTRETNMEQVVRDMVGRSITEYYPGRTNEPGEIVLEVKNFCQEGLFNNISFKLRKGEILGVAGLMGAGRTEIMRALFGVDSCKHGEVYLHGKKVCIKKPEDAIKAGIGFITENRKSEGLILDFSISRNIALPSVDTFAKRSVINAKNETAFSEALSKKLGVKTASIDLEAGALSGGNQQKVIFGKWLERAPKIFMMDEPTRGIDVGAKYEIYELIINMAKQGKTIIVVSSEMPEILGITNRIGVMSNGHLSGIVNTKETNRAELIKYMVGREMTQT